MQPPEGEGKELTMHLERYEVWRWEGPVIGKGNTCVAVCTTRESAEAAVRLLGEYTAWWSRMDSGTYGSPALPPSRL